MIIIFRPDFVLTFHHHQPAGITINLVFVKCIAKIKSTAYLHLSFLEGEFSSPLMVMDDQILYFSRRLHPAENWPHVALPISKEHLKSKPATIPSTTPNMCRDIDIELLEQVVVLLDLDNGRLKGW